MLDGKRVRKSLDTADWQRANQLLRDLEADKGVEKHSSVTDAVDEFLRDCEKRNLGRQTVVKYRETLFPLRDWCKGKAITDIRAVDFPTLRGYVREIPDSSLTVGKKIERLGTFFVFCEEEGWTDLNPARKIKKPKVTNKPVVPFTSEQYQAVVDAIEKYPARNSFGYDSRKRLRAYIYVLRYTGFRISDATQLRKDAIVDGKVLIRTTKTGAPVRLPLPPLVLSELEGIGNDTYFFWSGESDVKSGNANWQRTISRFFRLAGVEGHPHMFRHTLAVELLEKGVTVEHVAAILGNSPAIVYKHYAPWVASRQRALEEAVQKLWVTASE